MVEGARFTFTVSLLDLSSFSLHPATSALRVPLEPNIAGALPCISGRISSELQFR